METRQCRSIGSTPRSHMSSICSAAEDYSHDEAAEFPPSRLQTTMNELVVLLEDQRKDSLAAAEEGRLLLHRTNAEQEQSSTIKPYLKGAFMAAGAVLAIASFYFNWQSYEIMLKSSENT